MAINVFHRDEAALMLPLISSDARMIVWPGRRLGCHDELCEDGAGRGEQGARSLESEDTIVILEGRGSVADLRTVSL